MTSRASTLLALLLMLLGHAAGPGLAMTLGGHPPARQHGHPLTAAAPAPSPGLLAGPGAPPSRRRDPDGDLAALATAGLQAAQALANHGGLGRAPGREPSSAAAARHAGSILNDWIAYNKRSLPALSEDRLVLLDNVLSAVLRNVYKHHGQQLQLQLQQQQQQRERRRGQQQQQQQPHQQRQQHLRAERPGRSSRPKAFLDRKQREDEEEVEEVARSRSRSYAEPRLYVEARPWLQQHRRLDTEVEDEEEEDEEGQQLETRVPDSSSSSSSYLAEQPARTPAPGKRNQQQHQQQQQQQFTAHAEDQARQRQQQLLPKSPADVIAAATAGMASQFMLRSTRGGRNYDVPQIECPMSEDGMERFACPSSDDIGRYRCIDDHVLCDGFLDCPRGEDEDRQGCMFYKTTKAHLDVLADALLRWARGRR